MKDKERRRSRWRLTACPSNGEKLKEPERKKTETERVKN
jgi:hypothetical protein